MSEYDQINNLEEQLREDRRLALVRRRKRRLRWVIPLLLCAAAFCLLLILLINHDETKETEAIESEPPADAAVNLAFVGDISLNEQMLQSFRSGSDYDFSPCFKRITAQLSSADYTVGNLEGNITDVSSASNFCYPPSLLHDLYECGFDLLQTANTYSIQNGITGLEKTKQEILKAGMDPLGTYVDSDEWNSCGGVFVKEINGFRIAFLGFTKGVNNLRLPEGADHCVNLLYTDYDSNYSKIARTDIINTVENAKLQQPDFIIAMVHWGSEYTQDIAQSQKDIAELMFDHGVNLIIGSHSHYVGPMELRSRTIDENGGNFIAYSLGDFLSVADTTSALNGCILNIRIEKHDSEITITNVTYTPTYTAVPSSFFGVSEYEILDTLDAITFYESGYYNRISSTLYEKLKTAVARMQDQTGNPQFLVKK